ncbi:MAG: Na+/H+ antiporter NhaA [Chloroflexota bacterium]|nr:Na+/H+ antiporter NhaA [Chloroflexota bacterium]
MGTHASPLSPAINAGPLDRVLAPCRNFIKTEAAGGILLLTAAVVALLWANSPWGSASWWRSLSS